MKVKFINFWPGFEELQRGMPCNKWFLASLVNGEPVQDDEAADITFSSIFGDTPGIGKVIQFSGEAYYLDPEKFAANLICEKGVNNIISLPFGIAYLHSQAGALDRLTSRPFIRDIPKKFCCFIVSNPNCLIRNKMFKMLSKYKQIDSYGQVYNNTNIKIDGGWAGDAIKSVIAQYKFIICFENRRCGTYVTEKIVNPFLAGCVPIYWGSRHVLDIFNKDAFLYLDKDNPNDADLTKFCKQIEELDKDDNAYLKMRNEKALLENRLPKIYSLGSIKKNLLKLL